MSVSGGLSSLGPSSPKLRRAVEGAADPMRPSRTALELFNARPILKQSTNGSA